MGAGRLPFGSYISDDQKMGIKYKCPWQPLSL